MNERIKELASQCWDVRLDGRHFDQEQFAELIVRECADYAHKCIMEDSAEYPIKSVAYRIKKHFGVEE